MAPPTVPGVPAQASNPARPRENRPAHETVDADGCIGANGVARDLRHFPSAGTDDEPADAAVGDQDIRSSAEQRHGNAVPMRQT